MRQYKLRGLIAGASVLISGLLTVSAVQAEDIAVTGGTAYTDGGAGIVKNATILVSDGVIMSVAADGAVPEGYRVIDARGQWVTPGFMVSHTNLGLTEVPLSGGHQDYNLNKSAEDTISVDALDAYNPDSVLIPVTMIEGVTRAVTMLASTAEVWQGLGAIVHLGSGEGTHVKHGAFLGLDVTSGGARKAGGSRAALWQALRTKFDAILEKKPDTEEKGDAKKEKKETAADKTLKAVLAGELPLFVQAEHAQDIRRVIAFKKKYGVKVILRGAAEGWRVAPLIAEAGIPVVLDVYGNLPGDFFQLAGTQANAARLHAAGVKIAFMGLGDHNARQMPQMAGNAVANGLPWAAALDAMTKNPAEIFGIASSYGTLEAGKDADIVVWSGDPLELASAPTHILVQGQEQNLVSRQTKLRDRYKDLTPHPAYKR